MDLENRGLKGQEISTTEADVVLSDAVLTYRELNGHRTQNRRPASWNKTSENTPESSHQNRHHHRGRTQNNEVS